MELICQKLVMIGGQGVHQNEIFETVGAESELEKELIQMGLENGEKEGWFIYEPPRVMPNRWTYERAGYVPEECFERGPDGKIRWTRHEDGQRSAGTMMEPSNPARFVRLPKDEDMPRLLKDQREASQ